MTAFGIPEEHEEHWKVDGWRIALSQATTCAEVVEMECRLNASINFAVKRRVAMPHAPQLLRMCDERWHEIAAACGIPRRDRR